MDAFDFAAQRASALREYNCESARIKSAVASEAQYQAIRQALLDARQNHPGFYPGLDDDKLDAAARAAVAAWNA